MTSRPNEESIEEHLRLDPKAMKIAIQEFKRQAYAEIHYITQQFRDWDKLTKSEQLALYQYLHPYYPQALERVQRGSGRTFNPQHRELMINTMRQFLNAGRFFTYEEFTTAMHTLFRDRPQPGRVAVMNFLNTLLQEGFIYPAEGYQGSKIEIRYGFTDLLPLGAIPPSLADRKDALRRKREAERGKPRK